MMAPIALPVLASPDAGGAVTVVLVTGMALPARLVVPIGWKARSMLSRPWP
jgi:hypothetical protein